MRVLVTGGAGLIGMTLRRTLARQGHTVFAVDMTDFGRSDPQLAILPLEDAAGLATFVRDRSIDAIAHCGAISGPMLAQGNPGLLVRVNIDGTAALLELARIHRMQRFVFCSSISVYGDVGDAPITEETPLRPSSVYGATKVAGEQLIQGYGAEYGLDGVSLRIGRVYGQYRRANCHLRSVIMDADAGRPSVIPCAPDFVYHYVYVQDVAEAILAALQAGPLPHRDYNVGSGEALTMPQIAERATQAIPRARISLVPGADDVPDIQTVFGIGRIERELGWRPAFPLDKGLIDYRELIRSDLSQ